MTDARRANLLCQVISALQEINSLMVCARAKRLLTCQSRVIRFFVQVTGYAPVSSQRSGLRQIVRVAFLDGKGGLLMQLLGTFRRQISQDSFTQFIVAETPLAVLEIQYMHIAADCQPAIQIDIWLCRN